MYCIGICLLDDEKHFCIGCDRCFDNNCSLCKKGTKYEPIRESDDTLTDSHSQDAG
jgi:hypothetical protein